MRPDGREAVGAALSAEAALGWARAVRTGFLPCRVDRSASLMLPPRLLQAAMSTWRQVGLTYLKYADLCATHLRNVMKEPKKSKALGSSQMHARVVKWEVVCAASPSLWRRLRPPVARA